MANSNKNKTTAPAQQNTAPAQQTTAPAPQTTAPAQQNTTPAQQTAAPAQKMVKIRIPRTRADEEDVFISVNNYTCIIKRGVEVEVPEFVAEVLRHREEMMEQIMLLATEKKK